MVPIKIFEQKKVRTHFDIEKEIWYFSIIDVIQTDTIYLIEIRSGYFDDKYFELRASKSNIIKLFPEFPGVKSSFMYLNKNKFLIVRLSSVQKFRFRVEAECEQSEGNEPTASVYLSMSNSFLFKGELLDVIIKKEIEELKKVSY